MEQENGDLCMSTDPKVDTDNMRNMLWACKRARNVSYIILLPQIRAKLVDL